MTLKTLRGGKTPALFKKSIDWFYWKNMQSVNSWEASSLVCGIDPLDKSKHEQREKVHSLISSNAGNRAFFSMLYISGSQRFLLSEVAAWCLSIGFPIPDELMLLANTHEKNLKVAPPAQQDVEPTEKPLSENERTTMLKMIYGMAISGYGFKPEEKNPKFTGQTSDGLSAQLLQDAGIDVSYKTVKKYIDMAKELLGPERKLKCTPKN